jgi:hypothetical protein
MRHHFRLACRYYLQDAIEEILVHPSTVIHLLRGRLTKDKPFDRRKSIEDRLGIGLRYLLRAFDERVDQY